MLQKTTTLQQNDAKHHIHPFSDFAYTKKPSLTKIINNAQGVYIYDSDGNKVIDAMSGLWCVNMGYGQKFIIEAVYKQMQKMVYYNTFFGTSHPPAIKLSTILSKITPKNMDKVFFTSSGSEANDTMIRIVRYYWSLQNQPNKSIIISRKNAYHGSTVASASLGGMSSMHAQGGLPIADIVHIGQPYHYEACVAAGKMIDKEEYGKKMALELEAKIEKLGENRIAAFIAEPVQGAGGVIIPPKTYWPEINRICREHNILLVVDEVICGFGRLGEWFGLEHYNIKPDLITFAKGVTSGYMPLGGLIVSNKITETIASVNKEFAHGYTYSGHPACVTAAIANIELMQKNSIISQVKNHTSIYLATKIKSLAEHPLVGEVRSIGMLAAIEIVQDKNNFKRFANSTEVVTICRNFCFKNGLVMRSITNKMIIAPPLICTDSEIDEIIEKAHKCLDLTANAIK